MRYAVWAPIPQHVEVEAGGVRHPMTPAGRPGWWAAEIPSGDGSTAQGTDPEGDGRCAGDEPAGDPGGDGRPAGEEPAGDPSGAPGAGGRMDAVDDPGADYGFVLDGDGPFPDPRSLRQPHGVHGLSRPYDHGRFAWTDSGWRGRPLPGSVLYELHVGTFTPEGTFDAAAGRLDHLAALGVDAVELLPVAAFPGRHGWGYDGVDLWAVHEPYGGPDGLKRFVDACHRRGLAVVLDVVYNHLGPDGNHLGRYGPYLTDAYRTPWGAAVNMDRPGSDEVRAFVVENALMWLRDFHVDGLRLDAVHAIRDQRAVHILEEVTAAVDRLGAATGRAMFVIAESDLNDPRLVTSREAGGYGLGAQWSDDFHHALHAALTGERQGYYGDFGSADALAKTLTRVFFHDGTWSSFRGRSHGRPVDPLRVPADRFLGFLQNHDQVGNRATGDRISAGLPAGLLRVGAGLLLTAPFTPMLFMGEEWGASTPWRFFTDHEDPDIAAAVSEGRRREFAGHGWAAADVPDPQDPETYRSSILDWSELAEPGHRELLDWYRALIALRRAEPDLTDPRLTEVSVEYGNTWLVMRRGSLRIAANLGDGPVPLPGGAPLLASVPGVCRGGDLPGESFAVLRAQDPPEHPR